MQINETTMLIANLLNDKKAKDVDVIDIQGKASFADYLIIATGGSMRQVMALADDVQDKLSEHNIMPKNIEGRGDSGWILMDYKDFIVNIFSEDKRDKYSLEDVWADCEKIRIEE